MHNSELVNISENSKNIVSLKTEQIYSDRENQIYCQTDRMFAVLMTVQWIAGVATTLVISPKTWIGQSSSVHIHVWGAILLGAFISIVPIMMAIFRPGQTLTRYTIAVGQMLMSSLLIHVTGGRVETHFHIFGSLAFLSFYRDWRVLIPATVIVTLDHMLRGIFYPQSVFGVLTPEKWRWIEHAGWVLFEDVILIISCLRGQKEMRRIAEHTAELDAGEARYRAVTNSASDAIVTIDQKAKILYVNQSAKNIFGYEADEMIGQQLTIIVPEKFRQAHQKWIARYLEGDNRNLSWQAVELPALHKNGSEFSIEISFGEYQTGSQKLFTAVIRNITERKLAEEAIKKSEEYRNLFKLANDAIIIFEPETEEILDANDFACRLFGYERKELVGSKLERICRDAKGRQQRNAKLLKDGELKSFESVHYHKNGTPINVLINSSLIEFSGKPAVLSIKRDITSRVESDSALRESEYKLRTLVESMQEGLLHLDDKDEIIFANQRFCEMTGYTEEELIGRKASRFLIYREDRKIVEEANRRRGEGISESYELRLKTKRGAPLWSLVGAVPIIDSNNEIVGSMSIHSDITERKRAEALLIHNAMHDTLTELPNRSLFLEHLRRAMNRSPLRKSSFAVLFLDFDGFKLINDSLGHAAGDELLKTISQRLQTVIRANDIVARLGGDEFTILLDELNEPQDFLMVVNRIQQLFAEPLYLEGREVFISASIGIALHDKKYSSPEEILRDADIAMYRAKSAGKARYEIFNQEMHEQVARRLELETELRLAHERKEFRVFYQPIMHLSTNELIGFEALIRWFHPTRGLVMPADFITVAEETGIIVPIGEWVLEEGCRQVREWQRRYPEKADLTISINLSCKQFIQLDLAERVQNILQKTALDARNLRLEVTESHVMENSRIAINIMNDLRALGVRLSIDDFGTGYSSLSYLQRLPIDYLKIDRSFINLMNSNHENGEIVKAIVMLAKNLGMDVIAEGIETEDQAERLVNLECAFGQGYFYSKPADAAAAELILEKTPKANILSNISEIDNPFVS